MLDSAKRKMMERAMSSVTPSETAAAQALAEIIAGLEHEQAQAVAGLIDAAGISAVEVRHDTDAREEQLLDLADAVAEDRVAEYYLEQTDIDEPEKAAGHVGHEHWGAQKREWYSKYRELDVVDGPPAERADEEDVDEAAGAHVREVFGMELEQFERIVVEWDRGQATQDLLAGPLVGHTELINHVASVLEADES